MDPLVEIQFTAGAGARLAAALHAALQEDGQDLEQALLASWIADGHVRVDDEVVRDPQHQVAVGADVELSAWPAPAEALAPPPTVEIEEILHLDRHVLVAEYRPGPETRGGSEVVADHLNSLLERAGRSDVEPVLVPDHDPRASGLVAAGLKPRGASELEPASRPCGVRVSVKALVQGEPKSWLSEVEVARRLPGGLLVRTPPIRGCIEFRAGLEGSGLTVLETDGPEPDGTRPLLVHVAGLALTHPHTGHTQMWMCMQPPWFNEALKRLEATPTT